METKTFFNTIWGGLKDSYNYIDSYGKEPYLISRTLTIKEGTTARPYWNWYKDAFEHKTPIGTIQLPVKIEDVGKGTTKDNKTGITLTYLDFVNKGKKTIILFDSRYMTLKEEKSALKISAQKERAVLDLKKTVDATIYNIQKLGLAIVELKKRESKLNAAQKTVLEKAITLYHAKVNFLKTIDGIKISTSSYSTSNIDGLGLAPVIILVAVGIVVLGVLAYFTIDKILNSISAIKKTGYETELQTKALETLQKTMADPNIPKEEKQKIIDNTYKVVEDAEKEKALITKEESKANENSLLGNLKTIGYLALGGGVIFLLAKFIPQKTQNSKEYVKA